MTAREQEKETRVVLYSPRASGKCHAQCMEILSKAIAKKSLKISLVDGTKEKEAENRTWKKDIDVVRGKSRFWRMGMKLEQRTVQLIVSALEQQIKGDS